MGAPFGQRCLLYVSAEPQRNSPLVVLYEKFFNLSNKNPLIFVRGLAVYPFIFPLLLHVLVTGETGLAKNGIK